MSTTSTERAFKPLSATLKEADIGTPIERIKKREEAVREYYIAIEQAKIARSEVAQCYFREGVNHYQNCKEVVAKYKEILDTYKYGSLYHNQPSQE